MCANAFCNHCGYNIKCYTIQREKPKQKIYSQFFIQSKKYFRLSRNFFPARSKNREKERKFISTRNFHLTKSKKTLSLYKRRNNKHFKRNQRHSKIPFHLKERLLKITFLFLSIYAAFFKLF